MKFYVTCGDLYAFWISPWDTGESKMCIRDSSNWDENGNADPDYSRTINSLSESRGQRFSYTTVSYTHLNTFMEITTLGIKVIRPKRTAAEKAKT